MIPPKVPEQNPIQHPIPMAPQKRTRDEHQSAAAACSPEKQTRKTREVARDLFIPIHKFPISPEWKITKFRQDGSFSIGPTPPPASPERALPLRPRAIRGRCVIQESPPNLAIIAVPVPTHINQPINRNPSPPYDPFNPLPNEEYISATDSEGEEIDHISASDEEHVSATSSDEEI